MKKHTKSLSAKDISVSELKTATELCIYKNDYIYVIEV